MPELQPLLDRGRYTDEEWELSSAGLCDTVIEYGNGRGVVHCGQPASPLSFYRWCTEHDQDARDENPAAYGK